MTKTEAIELLNNDAFMICIAQLRDPLFEACYEALCMAIKALEQEPIIRCEDCEHHGTSNCSMWGDDTTEDYMWCCDGERKESDEE